MQRQSPLTPIPKVIDISCPYPTPPPGQRVRLSKAGALLTLERNNRTRLETER